MSCVQNGYNFKTVGVKQAEFYLDARLAVMYPLNHSSFSCQLNWV